MEPNAYALGTVAQLSIINCQLSIINYQLLIHRSLIYHTDGLALRDREATLRHEFYYRSEEYLVFQGTGDVLAQLLQATIVIGEHICQLYLNGHVVVVLVGGEGDEVVAGKFLKLHQYLLYLYREDIYAAQYHHIVATTLHTVDTDMVTSTRTATAQYTSEVASAIT